MLKIKLVPFGRKHLHHYRLCVAPENSKLTGSAVEVLGHYHPQDATSPLTYDSTRVTHWVKQGAQPTPKVRKLLWKVLTTTN